MFKREKQKEFIYLRRPLARKYSVSPRRVRDIRTICRFDRMNGMAPEDSRKWLLA
jgi:hypothetical protein